MSLLHHQGLRPTRSDGRRRTPPLPVPVTALGPARDEHFSPVAEFLRFLRDHLLVLAASTAAGLVLGYAYARNTVPSYRATTTIEVQDLNDNFLNLKEVASAAVPVSAANDLQTQVRILQSATLIGRVVQRIGLPGRNQPGPVSDAELEEVARGLQVRETRQSRIVDLSYEGSDPKYAAAFVNELAQQYIDQSVESRIEISRGTSAWLERQLEEMRAKLAESERRLQSYAEVSGLLVTNDAQRPDEEKLRQVQADLSKAQENRMAKQARRDMANAAPLESLEPPLNSALKDHRAKLADLRRQRADLAAVFTSEFAGVKRLDAQIADLEATEKKESAAALQAIRNDYLDALRREELLEASYGRQVKQVTSKASKAIQYSILKNEVSSNRELYNNMLQRAAEAKVASAMRASNARLVDRAKVPRLPFKPSRLLSILSGGTAGLLLGLVLVTARDRFARPVQNTAELTSLLRVPELGSVPDDPSPQVEAYRAILASILFSPAAGAPPQVITVTSSCAGEGKSQLVFKLAAALSQMKRRVLMIDGSRNGGLQQLFGQNRDYGLRDVVELSGPASDLLPYVTNPTRLVGVDLASIGPQDTSALDLMFTQGMEQLLAEMREAYDIVIIDTPALSDLPDARVFAKMADGVVLVVQAGKTPSDAVRAAVRRLQLDEAVVLGTVLNRV